MKVFLHEISEEDKELQFTAADPWVLKTVTRLDETEIPPLKSPSVLPEKKDKPASKPDRNIQAYFSLRKIDDVVIVLGEVEAPLKLLCSRCATPFSQETHTRFQMLFTKDPLLASGAPPRTGHHQPEASLETDSDISLLKEEFIDLSDVVFEQLQLHLPIQPLCKADCKGICSNCGADLNKGRCACGKITKSNPFAVLKDLKSKVSS